MDLKHGVTIEGIITGRSMPVFLNPGTRVRIAIVFADRLMPGDVAVVRGGCGYVAHRVLRLESGHLHTKADGGSYADAPIPLSACAGKVVAVLRGRRWMTCDTAVWRAAGLSAAYVFPLLIRCALVLRRICILPGHA